MPKTLPPHITEDDIRLITKMIAPSIMATALRDAADRIYLKQSAMSISYMLEDMADKLEKRVD